jgi:sec-independent protein translocase protein TatA
MTELALGSPNLTVLAIWGIGMPEMIVIAIIVLLLFGNRLPSVMKSLGQSITEFKKGTREGAGDDSDSNPHS